MKLLLYGWKVCCLLISWNLPVNYPDLLAIVDFGDDSAVILPAHSDRSRACSNRDLAPTFTR